MLEELIPPGNCVEEFLTHSCRKALRLCKMMTGYLEKMLPQKIHVNLIFLLWFITLDCFILYYGCGFHTILFESSST